MPAAEALPTHENMDRAAYETAVSRAKAAMAGGDLAQVVLSRRLDTGISVDPFSVYRALRHEHPSPYMYFIRMGSSAIVGASPEMLVRVEGRHVELHPIAGSRPRGADEAEDAVLLEALNSSEQVRAEHAELVGQVRRDVARVCEYGTVRVPRYMEVDRYSHVMQMVSTVEGQLDPGHDRFDALAACMPGGSVTGVPKRRAMQVIDDLEPDGRGIYAGAIGYLDVAGNLDFCTAIRTIAIRDGRASMQAGAPIGAETDPDDAFRETSAKTEALRRALVRAHDLT
jgi:anthranilate synthase component 1